MTDLESTPQKIYILVIISTKNVTVLLHRKKKNLKEAAQSFIEDHLDSFNLLRKHIWKDGGGGKRNFSVNFIALIDMHWKQLNTHLLNSRGVKSIYIHY